MTTTDRLRSWLGKPTDVAALVAFRVVFGVLVATSAARFFYYDWIDRFFVEPGFAFKYWGFAWVPIWPAWGVKLHIAALGVLGVCFAAGAFYRVVAPLLAVGFVHLFLMDASLYLNHYYQVGVLAILCCVLPLGRAGSIDAWRRPERALRSFPAWCTYLVRFQVGVVYVYAGLAKLSQDWLVHGQPLNVWLQARTDMPVLGELFSLWWFALALSWAGFLYDLTIPFWLSWRRSRAYAFGVVVVFHTLTHLLFNIGMFPLIMTSTALIFFAPDWPRRLLGERRMSQTFAPARPVGRIAFGALALFAAFAILVPLRHHLYPGDVRWNEDGMRWSWNVKVHEKNGAVTFYVTLPNGRRRIVRPSRYLKDYQEREMSGQPDLILQLAHHIRDDFAARGLGPVEVRAEAFVSLNGRRPAHLIDRSVDLARVEDGLGPKTWVLPMPEHAPRRLAAR